MDKVQIKDVATIVNGSTPSTKKPEYWDGDIPWITPKDLSSNHMRFVSRGERNITDEGYKSCSTTLLPKDTVLLTSRAPIGYLAIASCPMCTNQGFKSLICNQDKILPLYIYYWLSTRVNYLKGISTGATFKELSKSTLENVEIELPTISEQQHIVGVIGSVDDLIEKEEQILESIIKLIDGIYSRCEEGKRKIPLRQAFQISIGRTPPTKESQWFSDSEQNSMSWLSIKDMDTSKIYQMETSQFLTSNAIEHFNIPIVKAGDVLLSFKLTVGRVLIAGRDMVTNEAIACFKGPAVLRNYLYCFLKRCDFLSEGEDTSSIGHAVNSTIIKNFLFPMPSQETLKRFNDKTAPLFDKTLETQKEVEKLNGVKKALLHRYFGSN